MTVKKITILTPIFFGSGSGAATYYKILATQLQALNYNINIISDQEPAQTEDEKSLSKKVSVHPLFPARALQKKRPITDLFRYAIQNLNYLSLPFIIKHQNPNILLIHSSFLNHPSIISFALRIIKKKYPNIKIIVDVRDRGLQLKYINTINSLDLIIACSKNVEQFLKSSGANTQKIHHIPVIQNTLDTSIDPNSFTLNKYKLEAHRYLLYVGLIKKSKGVPNILNAYIHHLNKNDDYPLPIVFAGLMKEDDANIEEMLSESNVIYLGNLSPDHIHELMKNAALCINISPTEGMPRSSLEALTLCQHTLLPPNVPEFFDSCPDLVFNKDTPDQLAKLINKILNTKLRHHYPLDNHSVSSVIKQYIELFGSL